VPSWKAQFGIGGEGEEEPLMCGIAGILREPGQRVDPADLRSLAGALAHRGPDAEGFHADGNLGLAHRRLSILDLTPAGHQPMCNEDGSVWVVYNGQLFDFAPLRDRLEGRGHVFRSRTDTEVLVHLYEEKGCDLLAEVDGMFAFALWDARRRRLLLARDRLGIKPLVYAEGPGGLVFASELRALLALPWMRRDLDELGIVRYLYQASVPGEASVLRGIRKLPPAHRLIAEDGRTRIERYWALPEDPADGGSFDEAAAQLEARLASAVRSHLVADVPVGAFLSGGLDSTAVTRAAARLAGPALQTFSARFADARADEGPHAAEVAAALGTVHHELALGPELFASLPEVIEAADEPFAVASALALHRLARFARERVKVVLTGDGADELLAGYPWRHEPEIGRGSRPGSLLRALGLTAARSLRGSRAGGPSLAAQLASRGLRLLRRPDERYAEVVDIFTPEEMEALVEPAAADLAREAWRTNPVRVRYAAGGGDEVNRRLRADFATTLVDEMLTKVDRMTMAAGLEARVPFLDRGLVEWAFRLPGRHKVRGPGKRVLRRALAPSFPRAAARPKHGFDVPLGPWLRGPLRALLLDTLSPDAVRARGLLRERAVARIVDAHLRGRGDHSRKLFALMALEMWLRRWTAATSAQAASPATAGLAAPARAEPTGPATAKPA
jgi:asparagine synthase (glutamine-hydrolysing)